MILLGYSFSVLDLISVFYKSYGGYYFNRKYSLAKWKVVNLFGMYCKPFENNLTKKIYLLTIIYFYIWYFFNFTELYIWIWIIYELIVCL